MLVARVYDVLDAVVVEVSCVHSTDPIGSHLLIREQSRVSADRTREALLALSDVALGAACRMRLQDERGLPLGLEECSCW